MEPGLIGNKFKQHKIHDTDLGGLIGIDDLKRDATIARNSAGLNDSYYNKKITYHTARHTCATLLVHQGVPITTVQRILGHTSVRTTQIYSEVFAETLIKDLTLANEKSSLKNMEIVKRNRKKANNNTGKVPLAIE